ncbi:MAG: hypothetical protein QM753_00650 [Thermomicrobiales bacterium]
MSFPSGLATMDGRDFMEVAEALLVNDRQAFQRTSISRSYYAAFLEARSFSERYLGFSRRASGGEHQDVPRLIASFDFTVSDALRFLRVSRNTADYDLPVSPETIFSLSEDALDAARRIIAALDAHADRLDRERQADESSSASQEPSEGRD